MVEYEKQDWNAEDMCNACPDVKMCNKTEEKIDECINQIMRGD